MRLENNPTELQFVINTSTSNKNIDKLFKRNNIELQAKIIKFKLKKKKKSAARNFEETNKASLRSQEKHVHIMQMGSFKNQKNYSQN